MKYKGLSIFKNKIRLKSQEIFEKNLKEPLQFIREYGMMKKI